MLSRQNGSRRNWSRRNGSRRNRSRRTRMLPKIQCSVQVDTMDPSLSNSTPMDSLNATDSSPGTGRLSSLACLTSVRSDHLPSCSLWCRCCSLAPNAICLSHSVDSSALSYTVRSPPSRSIAQNILKSFSTCTNLKCTCTFVSVRSI